MLPFLKLFSKKTFIAFFKEEGIFYVEKLDVKKGKIIEKVRKDFKDEKSFLHFIKMSLMDNSQTYISTLIMNYNQGCVDSCSSKRYKQLDIHTEHVKISCINKKYSIYVGILELEDFKKEMQKYSIDLIYSPYLIIDLNKEITNNVLYVLITKGYIVLTIYYKKDFPEYSSILELNKEENDDDGGVQVDVDLNDISDEVEEIADIEEIGDMEDLDDLDSLNNSMEDDELEEDENIEHLSLKEESDIINFIKDSTKDYYANYSDEFLQNICILKSYDFSTAFLKDLEDEFLVKLKAKKVDLLKDINSLARKDINV